MRKRSKKVCSLVLIMALCVSWLHPINANAALNYVQNWNDGGNINFQYNLSAGNFGVSWSNTGLSRFTCGLGWSAPVARNKVIGYNVGAFQCSSYSPAFIGVYGWSRNPSVEFYIIDIYGGYRPSGGTYKGTVSSDGGQYSIYQTMKYSQPSINGTTTFPQYWSVRNSSNSIGQNHTITVANHFNAWARLGMHLGDIVYMAFVCEGFNSPSGYANATVW